MKKILVTGGYGFIGSNLVNKLIDEGNEVFVIDNLSTGNIEYENERATYFLSDVRDDLNELPIEDIDVIFHLAGLARIQPSFENPTETLSVNSFGTLNICEFARKNNIMVVYAGSSSFYHGPHKSPYAFSKWQGEEICRMYAENFGLNVGIARFFNVFGPRHTTEGMYATVVGVFQRQYLTGEPLTITWDGEQRRDFTHVNNIMRGLIKISDSPRNGEIFNLGTCFNYSINELADMFGKDYPRVYIEKRPGDARSTLADLNFCKEQLDYEPIETLSGYMKNWMEENK